MTSEVKKNQIYGKYMRRSSYTDSMTGWTEAIDTKSPFEISPLACRNENLNNNQKNYFDLDRDCGFIVDLFNHFNRLTNEKDKLSTLQNVIIPLFSRLQNTHTTPYIKQTQDEFQRESDSDSAFWARFIPTMSSSHSIVSIPAITEEEDSPEIAFQDADITKYTSSQVKFNSEKFNKYYFESFNESIERDRNTIQKHLRKINFGFKTGNVSIIFSSLIKFLEVHKKESKNDLVPTTTLFLESEDAETGIIFKQQNLIGYHRPSKNLTLFNKSAFAASSEYLYISVSSQQMLSINLSEDIVENQKREMIIKLPETRKDTPAPGLCVIRNSLIVFLGGDVYEYIPLSNSFIKIKKKVSIKAPFTSDGNMIYSLVSNNEVTVAELNKKILPVRSIKLEPALTQDEFTNASIVTNGSVIQFIIPKKAMEVGVHHRSLVYSSITGKRILEFMFQQNVDIASFDPLTRNLWSISKKGEISRYSYDGPDSPAVTGIEIRKVSGKKPNPEKITAVPRAKFAGIITKTIDHYISKIIGNRLIKENNPFVKDSVLPIVLLVEKILNDAYNDIINDIKYSFLRTCINCITMYAQSSGIKKEESDTIMNFLLNIQDKNIISVAEMNQPIAYMACSLMQTLISLGAKPNMFLGYVYENSSDFMKKYILNEMSKSQLLYKSIDYSLILKIIMNFDSEKKYHKDLVYIYIKNLFKDLAKDKDNLILDAATKILDAVKEIVIKDVKVINDVKSQVLNLVKYVYTYAKTGRKNIGFISPFITNINHIIEFILKGINISLGDECPIFFNKEVMQFISFMFVNMFQTMKFIADMKVEQSFASQAALCKEIIPSDPIATIEDVYKIQKNIRNKHVKNTDLELKIYRALVHQLNMSELPPMGEVNRSYTTVVWKLYKIRDVLTYSRQKTAQYDAQFIEWIKRMEEREEEEEMRERTLEEDYEKYSKLVESKCDYLLCHSSKMKYSEENLELLKDFITNHQTVDDFKGSLSSCKDVQNALLSAIASLDKSFGFFIKKWPVMIPFIGFIIEDGVMQKLMDSCREINDYNESHDLCIYYRSLDCLREYAILPPVFAMKAYIVSRAVAMNAPNSGDMVKSLFSEYFEVVPNKSLCKDAEKLVDAERIIACLIQSTYLDKNGKDKSEFLKDEEKLYDPNDVLNITKASLLLAGHIENFKISIKDLFSIDFTKIENDKIIKYIHSCLNLAEEYLKRISVDECMTELKILLRSLGTLVCDCPSEYFTKGLRSCTDDVIYKQFAVETAEMIRSLILERSDLKDAFTNVFEAFLRNDEIEEDNLFDIIGVFFVLSNTFDVSTEYDLQMLHGQLMVNVSDGIGTEIPITVNSTNQTIEMKDCKSRQHLIQFVATMFKPDSLLLKVFQEILQNPKYENQPLLRYFALKSLQEYINDPNTSESFTKELTKNMQFSLNKNSYGQMFSFSDSSYLFEDILKYGIKERKTIGLATSPLKPKLVNLSAKFTSETDNDLEFTSTSIETGDGYHVFLSTILNPKSTTKFTFTKISSKKSRLNAGIQIHSPYINMTKSIYYDSVKDGIVANRRLLGDIPKESDSIEFVYVPSNENEKGFIEISAFNEKKCVQSLEVQNPEGAASIFLIVGPNRNVKLSIETQLIDGTPKMHRSDSIVFDFKRSFLNIEKVIFDGSDELPPIKQPSYSGSAMPMELPGTNYVCPIIHHKEFENIPFDVIKENAKDVVSSMLSETLTQLLSASLRFQLNDTILRFNVDQETAVRFIMGVAVMLEKFNLSSNQKGVPLELDKGILDEHYQCTNASMLEHLEAARMLYQNMITESVDGFLKALVDIMEQKFLDPEMHFATKWNTTAKVVTGLGEVKFDCRTILIASAFNDDKKIRIKKDKFLKYYTFVHNETCDIQEKDVPIIAIETSNESNNFAFGTFLELAVYWKYAVFLASRHATDISDENRLDINKRIIKYLWSSITSKSPFFITNGLELLKFSSPRVVAGRNCTALFKEILENGNLPSKFNSHLEEELADISVDATESIRDFYPQISGKTTQPDPSLFEIPMGALKLPRNGKFINRILRPASSIKGFPVHLILDDWAEMFVCFAPIDVSIDSDKHRMLHVRFTAQVPRLIEFANQPISVTCNGRNCSRNGKGEWEIDGDQIDVTFRRFTAPKSLVILARGNKKEEAYKYRSIFEEDMKKWIAITPNDDMKILNIAEGSTQQDDGEEEDKKEIMFETQLISLNDIDIPLRLAVLRMAYLLAFNAANKSIDNLGEMARFVSLKSSVGCLWQYIIENNNGVPLQIVVSRDRANLIREGVSKDISDSAIGQITAKYKDPLQMRVLSEQPLSVTFEGEEGIDYSGLMKEFIMMVTNELKLENLGMFTMTPNARDKQGMYQDCIVPVPNITDSYKHYYITLGAVIATIIRCQKAQPFCFAPLFWMYMGRGMLTPDDIYKVDQGFRDRIRLIEASAETMTDEEFEAKFHLENTVQNVLGQECIIDGARQKVTRQMVRRYITSAIRFRIEELSRPLEWIREGLWKSFGFECPNFVTPWVLEHLACVDRSISMVELQKAIKCSSLKYREWLLSILEQYDNTMRSRFLVFVTGSPVLSMNSNDREISLSIDDDIPEDQLPTAHTCFNELSIPKYSSRETLVYMLQMAIDYCQDGFHIA